MYVYQSHARSALLLPGTEHSRAQQSKARSTGQALHPFLRSPPSSAATIHPRQGWVAGAYKASLKSGFHSRIASHPIHKAPHFILIGNPLSHNFTMLAFILAPLALLASALAAPVAEVHALKNFMLLSSPIKSTSTANTTGLNLVDPYHQTNFLLRAQEDAGSVFNLTTYALFSSAHGCS
jgi:hypothetical protein